MKSLREELWFETKNRLEFDELRPAKINNVSCNLLF